MDRGHEIGSATNFLKKHAPATPQVLPFARCVAAGFGLVAVLGDRAEGMEEVEETESEFSLGVPSSHAHCTMHDTKVGSRGPQFGLVVICTWLCSSFCSSREGIVRFRG